VLRRCSTILSLSAVAAALASAAWNAPAGADTITTREADYTLTFPNGLAAADPNATSPQLIATLPTGSIVPQTDSSGKQESPLTINSSSGFDTSGLLVLLRDDPSDASQQQFGLSFFSTGVQSGGTLNFGLSLNSSLSQPPTLDFTTPSGGTVGLTGTWADASSGSGSGTTGTGTGSGQTTTPQGSEVPEPLSLAIWTSMSVLALWNARRRIRPADRHAAAA
jgi:hypothetical protein